VRCHELERLKLVLQGVAVGCDTRSDFLKVFNHTCF
jgi:hypothetical protein